jgi:LysM domain.
MIKKVVVMGLMILAIANCGNTEAPKGHLVSEFYIVKSGDTLDEIASKFIAKSSVRRDIREFREGIIELNYDNVFKDRYPHGAIYAGDHLQINYWVKD